MIPVIVKHSAVDRLFGSAFRVGRNEKIEETIMNEYPQHIFNYALNVIQGRWPEAEHIIMKDPKYAYLYALEIINDRWIEAEQYIMEDPYFSYEYALNVIQGRWPEAEHVIMTDTNTALLYACEILEHKWIEAEEYMNGRDKENEAYYLDEFYEKGDTLNNIRMRRDLEKMLSF